MLLFLSLKVLAFTLVSIAQSSKGAEPACANPLLSQFLNIWAPIESLDSPVLVKGLDICKNLEGKQACCAAEAINDYKRQWAKFKEYFDGENARQVDIQNERVRYAYKNKADYKTAVREMRSLIDAGEDLYTSLRDALDQSSLEDIKDRVPNRLNVDVAKIRLPPVLREVEKLLKDNSGLMNSTYESLVKYLKGQEMIDDLINMKDDPNIKAQDLDFLRSPLKEEDIDEEVLRTQDRLRKFVQEREKCLTTATRHFASVLCVMCDARNHGFSKVGKTIALNLSTNTCVQLLDGCFEYLNSQVELNKNMVLAANMESLMEIYNSIGKDFNLNDPSTIISYLDLRMQTMAGSAKRLMFYRMPVNCSDSRNCGFICKEFINSIGINLTQILNGTMLDDLPFDMGIVENGVDVMMKYINGNSRRALAEASAAVNLSYYSSPDATVFYDQSFEFDSFKFADTTGVDFFVDGTGRIKIFNLTGDMTGLDLDPVEQKEFSINFARIVQACNFIFVLFAFICIFF